MATQLPNITILAPFPFISLSSSFSIPGQRAIKPPHFPSTRVLSFWLVKYYFMDRADAIFLFFLETRGQFME